MGARKEGFIDIFLFNLKINKALDAHTSGLHPNIIHPIYNIFIAEKKKKKTREVGQIW